MADQVLFSSGATGAKRLAVIADDAVSPVPTRIEIRDAANVLQITHVLTTADKNALVSAWHSDVDRTVQLKSTNPQLWVAMPRGNTSVWSGDVAGNDVNSVSEEITLDEAQTSAVMGWVRHVFVP